VQKLSELFLGMVDSVFLWVSAAIHPLDTMNELLKIEDLPRLYTSAAKIWAVAFVLGAVLFEPVFSYFGIQWGNVGFELATCLIEILMIVSTVVIAHCLLRMAALKSDFPRTLVIYSTLVITYSPITNLLNLYPTFRALEVIQALRLQNLAIEEAFLRILKGMLIGTISSFGIAIDALQFVGVFAALFVFTVFAESVSQWYENDRFRVYAVVSGAMVLSKAVGMLLFGPAYALLIYAHLGGPKT
jgi:hypothetical protein